jgi:hypothetical protein
MSSKNPKLKKLKAVREAFDKKDFQSAHDTSLQILEDEPENYLAYVPRCVAISRFDGLQSGILWAVFAGAW